MDWIHNFVVPKSPIRHQFLNTAAKHQTPFPLPSIGVSIAAEKSIATAAIGNLINLVKGLLIKCLIVSVAIYRVIFQCRRDHHTKDMHKHILYTVLKFFLFVDKSKHIRAPIAWLYRELGLLISMQVWAYDRFYTTAPQHELWILDHFVIRSLSAQYYFFYIFISL